jgi:plasmid replication initiation protein
MRHKINNKTMAARQETTASSLLSGQGRDELNLAEFPFAMLQYQRVERRKTIEFADTITGKDGQTIQRQWTVTGSDAHGLSVAADVDIVIALLVLTQEQGLKGREVQFTRYDLLRIMGWDNRGHNYARVKAGLERLVGTTIKAERAFYDRQKQAYLTRAFHIIDDYDLWDRADGAKQSEPDRLPLKSVATWNRHIFRSLKAGYVKRLDAQRYFRLATPIAKQLFRYLDKKFYRDRHFQIDIFKLCHEHLGISRGCRHVSKLKERLTPALDELVRDGYLETYRYAPSASNRRSMTV